MAARSSTRNYRRRTVDPSSDGSTVQGPISCGNSRSTRKSGCMFASTQKSAGLTISKAPGSTGVSCGASVLAPVCASVSSSCLENLFSGSDFDPVSGACTHRSADSVAIGVVPRPHREREEDRALISHQLVVTADLFESKRPMLKFADSFVVLLGGDGTPDALAEVRAGANTGRHQKLWVGAFS